MGFPARAGPARPGFFLHPEPPQRLWHCGGLTYYTHHHRGPGSIAEEEGRPELPHSCVSSWAAALFVLVVLVRFVVVVAVVGGFGVLYWDLAPVNGPGGGEGVEEFQAPRQGFLGGAGGV